MTSTVENVARVDETHDAGLRSWVDSANVADTDFPLQNLPYGVYREVGSASSAAPRIGVAIGSYVLDVAGCRALGMLEGQGADACQESSLNALMALRPEAWSSLRRQLSALLRMDGDTRPRRATIAESLLKRMDSVEMVLPASIGDYSDFYASIDHATNVGSMFRPDNPLLPNYKWIPIGYHGRASSIVVSGTSVSRPAGQRKPADAATPIVGPSQSLDYELEVGLFVGGSNALGSTIPIADAPAHMFGLVLVNDWSARDLQAWEYQPLGPFLAKSFATSISPWVVTLDALAPFRVAARPRGSGDPPPLPYLLDAADQHAGGIDMTLEVWLSTASMRERGVSDVCLSRGRFADMYWTLAQMLAHHTVAGCNLRPADLLASGTVSGADEHSRGCLLELTWRGTKPITLPTGEERRFLEDGDQVTLRGWCERPGARRIGLGSCTGVIV